MSDDKKADPKAADPKADPKATDPAVKQLEDIKAAVSVEPAPEVKVEKGTKMRVRAAHGYIQHPFTLEAFNVDSEKKVVVDDWLKVQLEAGKLVQVED